MNRYKRFWSSIPKASDIKVTKANGQIEFIRVTNKKHAAKTIRDGRKKS